MLEKQKRIKDPVAYKAARRPYCVYCGKTNIGFTVHHIKTRGSGGHDIPTNLINLCIPCHARAHTGEIRKSDLYDMLGMDLARQ